MIKSVNSKKKVLTKSSTERGWHLNSTWQSTAENQLEIKFENCTTLGGGDFASSYKVVTNDQTTLFVKTHANPPPAFFTTEATGLRWLRATGTVNIPEVLGVNDQPPYLALAWVEPGAANAGTEVSLGRQLAALHLHKQGNFGREDLATTGSLAVPNQPCESWCEFYATQRLMPLIKLAASRQTLAVKELSGLGKIASRLSGLNVPEESASLLHGDLWAGNRLVDQRGDSWLIDPAAHCGHREFELGMMTLFGGYTEACFAAYHESYPLSPGWQERLPLHQLAPLIVHAIKFGGSYKAAVMDAMARYV